MPKPIRREEAKFLTRRRLLDAAATLLGETGYAGLSASAVTRAAGVAQPTFYVHFRDKNDLVRTLADEKIGVIRLASDAAARGAHQVAARSHRGELPTGIYHETLPLRAVAKPKPEPKVVKRRWFQLRG